ncbi:MAG: ribonuclease III [Proteobacteria bacterium]|nr:ribonuclease III [Pseudomonadota bacterium]
MAQAALAALEDRLGHRFQRRDLIEQALTHASALTQDEARRKSYQRLEFLGDRVLGLAIAALLQARFPEAAEGQLSRALADLVRKETCAEVAREIGVSDALRIGKGEKKTGLNRKVAVLGDACEAILGAVYLDAGFPAAEAVISAHWSHRVPDITGGAMADPKTALQEWAHTQGLAEPTYREVGRAGPDHAPVFRVEVVLAGLSPVAGEGQSKRVAERTAAAAMLARETGGQNG